METAIEKKILLFGDLLEMVQTLQGKKKVVVQSHGIYDLVHPGIIMHLNQAREQGDILVVTVIRDKDIRRGPARPIFTEDLRAYNAASCAQVDYVAIVDDAEPFECVKKLKPDVFARGQSFRERHEKINAELFKKEKELYFGQIRTHETNGFSFSSSHIVNNFLDIYPPETKQFIKEFNGKYGFDYIAGRINALSGMKVLLIGDGIIDEYFYTEPMGRSAKANLVVNRYLSHEAFTVKFIQFLVLTYHLPH